MGLAQSKDKGADPTFTSQTWTKTDGTPKVDSFISSLIKARKDLLLYPASNPVVAESIGKVLEILKEHFSSEETVELLVEKDRLMVNEAEVQAKDPRVKELCLSLYKRSVRKIILDTNISFDEIKLLLGTIILKVEEIAKAGGIEKLTKCRGIVGAVVEESDELTIVDADSLPITDDIPGFEALEEVELSMDELTGTESLNRMFVKGDLASLKSLRVLLRNPQFFSGVLEKFALRLEKAEGEVSGEGKVERLLKILNTVGAAIAGIPSEEEQSQLFKNLTVSVLGLSASLREELISQGLVPNLKLRNIESRILSRLPISQMADALLENFEVSGGTASVMSGYFANIDLNRTDRISLADTLKNKLSDSGMLTPEIETVLTLQKVDLDIVITSDKKIVFPREFSISLVEGYPAEKVLFLDDERTRLMNQISEELEAPTEEVMVPALLELLHYDTSPASHALLVERTGFYTELFLAKGDYERAAILVKGLQEDFTRKQRIFSRVQLATLKKTLEEYLSERKINVLVDAFRSMNRESPDFEKLVKYFDAVGSPAVEALVHSLENEESRHVRLLICQAISEIGERCIVSVGQKLDHPKWFVVRNAVAILGQTGSPACISYLRKAMSHKDIRVRKEAMRALASIKTDEAVELLCNSLDDEDPTMCKAALGWIAAIGTEQALPPIERLLSGKKIWKKGDDLLELAIEALASIGSDSAVALLKQLSQTHSFFRRRKANLIRQRAIAALRDIEGEQNS